MSIQNTAPGFEPTTFRRPDAVFGIIIDQLWQIFYATDQKYTTHLVTSIMTIIITRYITATVLEAIKQPRFDVI